ncbi:hypothetical protein [Paenibacillus xylaniclasticus]|uniref:hypothetical protein n=1 Tax=Paenibacillus xylaniclasticus TaxID=588083 RepID=UPI000FD8016C|nr:MULTISPECIES: hypothetical protein [Paenibacillus]GFN31700.1 hypothetical protein PCURB6_19600 [Paenibacillus curdlanolyticus]
MANVASAATVDNLIEQMRQQGSVLNGWDIVFNMTESAVNEIFGMVYRKLPSGPWKELQLRYCETFPDPSSDGILACYTRVEIVLSSPQLSIVPNAKQLMRIDFKASGLVHTASTSVDASFDPSRDADFASPALKWHTVENSNTSFSAIVPLSVVEGSVIGTSAAYASVLDFPAGSFESPLFADMDHADTLQVQLRLYFATNKVRYMIQGISSSVVNQLPDLTPRSFRIASLATNSGRRLLQLFIATTGPLRDNLTIQVNEPVPDGSDLSIMLDKRISDELGGADISLVNLFTAENLIFPASGLIQLGANYTPYDRVILGRFLLAPHVTIKSGDQQHVTRQGLDIPGGTARFAPLAVTVTDAFGSPLAGIPVRFVGVGSPTMAVQLQPIGASDAVAVTDNTGTAVLNQMGGNSVVAYYNDGVLTVTASTGDGASAVFHLTVDPQKAPPILPGAKVNIVEGNKQTVGRSPERGIPSGVAKFAPLKVQVVDAHGVPIPNALVNFSPGNHPSSMAVQLHPSGASPVTVLSDAQGIAVLNAMSSSGAWAYYATGTFNVTASVAGGAQQAVFQLTAV